MQSNMILIQTAGTHDLTHDIVDPQTVSDDACTLDVYMQGIPIWPSTVDF